MKVDSPGWRRAIASVPAASVRNVLWYTSRGPTGVG